MRDLPGGICRSTGTPYLPQCIPLHPPFFFLPLASCPPTNQILLESKLALVFAGSVPFFSDFRIPDIRTLYSSLQRSTVFEVCACSVIGVDSGWDSNSDKSRGVRILGLTSTKGRTTHTRPYDATLLTVRQYHSIILIEHCLYKDDSAEAGRHNTLLIACGQNLPCIVHKHTRTTSCTHILTGEKKRRQLVRPQPASSNYVGRYTFSTESSCARRRLLAPRHKEDKPFRSAPCRVEKRSRIDGCG